MTTTMRALAALAVAATLWPPATVAAQDATGPRAAVDQLFEGMRTADPDEVRAVLAPDARFAVLSQRDGPVMVVAQSVEGWVRSIGSSEGRWDERVYDVQVSVDGAMASVWAPYTFYLDGAISHCGINSIELLRDAEGWKITQISDTRRRDGCPDPRGG